MAFVIVFIIIFLMVLGAIRERVKDDYLTIRGKR